MPRNTSIPFRLTDPDTDMEQEFIASLSVGPDELGNYGTFIIPVGSNDYDAAKKIIQRLHRPRKRRKFLRKNNRGSYVIQYGLSCEIITLQDGKLGIKYFATTDAARKRYMLETYGENPESWPFSTNKKHKNYG
jgi:hypothetical protein